MNKTVTRLREKDGRWCAVDIRLENGRLAVTGAEGVVLSRAQARKEALRFWESYFEEQREQLGIHLVDYAKRSARHVIEHDGELHGLDVHAEHDDKVYVTESAGCIHGVIAEWFPEVVPLLRYHLNDMHAECEHQEARGESWTTHPLSVCPDCGYKIGSAWLKRELPREIIERVAGM